MPMFTTTDGTKLYYEDTGKGPTLVFCHGLNSSHLAIKNFIDEFRNEYLYNSTMAQVKKLLEEGLISEEYYWQINTKMKAKYRPVSDGLISENELICALKRA